MVANLSKPEEDFKQITIIIYRPYTKLNLVVFNSLEDPLRFSSTLRYYQNTNGAMLLKGWILTARPRIFLFREEEIRFYARIPSARAGAGPRISYPSFAEGRWCSSEPAKAGSRVHCRRSTDESERY